MSEPRKLTKEERKVRKALGTLIICVRQFEVSMDELMKQPATVERGKDIAYAMNGLTLATDQALYYGLGMDFRKDRKGARDNYSVISKYSRRANA